MSDYRKVSVEDLPNTPNPTREKKEVDEAVGTSLFGFNVYRADPGDPLPWGYHRHPDHEELFYVVAGELAVETDEGTVRLERGEALFVPPNAGNRARVVGDEPAEVIAVGAPKDEDGAVIEEECPECGAVTDREFEAVERDGETAYVLYCSACGAKTGEFTD